MERVGLRELKNRLSHYVRRVRAGRALLVTDRGEVVAELLPPRPVARDHDGRRKLAALVRRGTLTLGASNSSQAYPRLPRRLRRGELKRLLEQEREER